jgi:hypothetical protein
MAYGSGDPDTTKHAVANHYLPKLPKSRFFFFAYANPSAQYTRQWQKDPSQARIMRRTTIPLAGFLILGCHV